MLVPRAWKRKPIPSDNKAWLRAPNTSVCAFSSAIEVENRLHRAGVGSKPVEIARNRVCNFVEIAKRGVEWLWRVKRHKAADEQFRYRPSLGKRLNFILGAVLQEKNPADR